MKKKRILMALGIALGVMFAAVLAIVAYSSSISRPLFDDTLTPELLHGIEIADPKETLTFARYKKRGDLQVLLVRAFQEGEVEGTNLNEYFNTDATDPIHIFTAHGYDELSTAALSGSFPVSVSAEELEMPFDSGGRHIGIGANYRAHAIESGAGDEPFVFPKIPKATHFDSPVGMRKSLRLDYEAELGFVALEDISTDSAFPEFMGLVLCNDFTDRWTLVRQMDLKAPMGTTGFPDGKGKNGFLPIGNFLVIPRDLESFYPEIELSLYLNGKLRQKAKAGMMIWDPAEMLRQIFLRSNWEFLSERGSVPLLSEGGNISAGSIILSGTPEGVIFRLANIWNRRLYLAEGDEVIIRAERMGIMRNTITE
ncbi:MAG: fumarylacetoacetate hydrolase family protein [Planctomycetota bacterium]|jgi:2-keto-4-pentenoate hydratase/2-oxohepta-3-ene-1,7-dioic acid hydratase in catechol pathway